MAFPSKEVTVPLSAASMGTFFSSCAGAAAEARADQLLLQLRLAEVAVELLVLEVLVPQPAVPQVILGIAPHRWPRVQQPQAQEQLAELLQL